MAILDQIEALDPEVLRQAILQSLGYKKPDVPSCCPNCGIDWRLDKIIRIDGFTIDPREGIWFGDKRLKLSKTHRSIMNSLAKERGRWLSVEQLANRCTDLIHADVDNAIKQHISALRARLRLLDVPVPIATEHGCGYYWKIAGS
jgi:DNA-binding response OmpR family regulator